MLPALNEFANSIYRQYFGDLKIITQSIDFTASSIPDVAADADRQDISNRVSENNIINAMKSGLPIIGSNQMANGGIPITKRISPQKPLRLSEHGNRPILPPKPTVKQDSFDRIDAITRSSSVFSQVPNASNAVSILCDVIQTTNDQAWFTCFRSAAISPDEEAPLPKLVDQFLIIQGWSLM